MVISIWHPCVVLSCIVLPGLLAKTFSLNEAIAAEERIKGLQTTTRPKFEPGTPEKLSLNKIIRSNPKTIEVTKATKKPERFSLRKALRTVPVKSKKLKATGNIFPRGKKISSLQYRKTFQIKSPLKPKKLKNIQKARHRRRNQSTKREINKNEHISKKYIPLLRSLSMLFDNILAKADDSYEDQSKLRKYRHSTKNKAHQCTCSGDSGKDVRSIESAEKTVVSTTPIDEEVSTDQSTEPTTAEASTATTDRASNSDVSDLGQNSDLPAILPRDSHSNRRDYHGVSTGSRPTLHTSVEGNISRDNGDSERNTGSGEHKPYTKNHEKDPDGTTREHASSSEFGRGLRGDGSDSRRPVYRGRIEEAIANAERKDADDLREDRRNFNEFEGQIDSERKDSFRNFRGDFIQPAGENKYEVGGDETESSRPVQQFVRGDRRFASEGSFNDYSKPEEDLEEGAVDVAHYIAGNKRLADGNGSFTAEDKKISKANAAIMSINDLNNSVNMLQNSPKHKAPYVTIIDGYSVARDKNGPNKLAEQSIRFHS